MKLALGEEQAYKTPISSTKSMTGHMFGATEAAITVLTQCRDVLPPTINYETPDPRCDLDYVPNEARADGVKMAMSTGSLSVGTTRASCSAAGTMPTAGTALLRRPKPTQNPRVRPERAGRAQHP